MTHLPLTETEIADTEINLSRAIAYDASNRSKRP